MKLDEFTPEELHVVWVATAQYLASVAIGEIVILSDPESWPQHLSTAVEKLTRAKNKGRANEPHHDACPPFPPTDETGRPLPFEDEDDPLT
jgi:hypothetical protein